MKGDIADAKLWQSMAFNDGFQKGRAEGYRAGLEAAAKELGRLAVAAVERAQEAESSGDFTLMNIRRTVAQGLREGAAAIRALAKEA